MTHFWSDDSLLFYLEFLTFEIQIDFEKNSGYICYKASTTTTTADTYYNTTITKIL